MKRKILILIIAGLLILGGAAIANEENNNEASPEDIELAIVDYWHAEREISIERLEGITYSEVHEKATEKGYELIVEKGSLELFLDGVLSEISDLKEENVTEEVIEIVTRLEEVEEHTDIEDIEEFEEIEWIKEITEDVIEWFAK